MGRAKARPLCQTLGNFTLMKFLHLIAIWAIFSSICVAGEKENKAITEAFPETTTYSSSTGLVEGKSYLSAVLRKNNENSVALALFQLDETGNYKLIAKSAWWLEHQRWYSEITKIKNNSVYFSLSGSGGCCSDYSLQHQFKMVNRKFTLIGSEESEIGIELQREKDGTPIDEKYISYKSGSSSNYLTNTVKKYRIVRDSSPTPANELLKDDFLISKNKKRVVLDKKTSLSRTKKVLLENFDIWEEMDNDPK